MDLDEMELGTINSFANRIVHFAECVAEAHKMGHGPGKHKRPWELDFQRKAVPVYAETLPPTYLRGMADASSWTARLMTEAEVEEPTVADWDIVTGFLRSTAGALTEDSEIAAIAPRAGLSDIASIATGLLRYERFAELLHPRGTDRIRHAAASVAGYCLARLTVAPTAQELGWIISVAVNEPIERLAARSHISTRGMYHRLESMWRRLGVRTPVQGVALAVQRGWITPLRYFSQQCKDQEELRHKSQEVQLDGDHLGLLRCAAGAGEVGFEGFPHFTTLGRLWGNASNSHLNRQRIGRRAHRIHHHGCPRPSGR